MTVQLTQIQPTEPRLSQEPYTQNTDRDSFQNYLDNEQERLSLMLSALPQFNLSAWLSYANFNPTNNQNSGRSVDLFSDLKPADQTNSSQTQYSNNSLSAATPPATNIAYDPATNYYLSQLSQPVLQELLEKTGWLSPNLEASPQLFLAQLENKMLNKLDLQFLVDQIVTQAKLVKGKGETQLSLGLKPENLGEIIMTLTSRSGMIGIQIEASEETKKLLDSLVNELERALKRSKINVAEIKIISNQEVNKHA